MDLVGKMETNWISEFLRRERRRNVPHLLLKADRATCLETLVPWFDSSWCGRRLDKDAIDEMAVMSEKSPISPGDVDALTTIICSPGIPRQGGGARLSVHHGQIQTGPRQLFFFRTAPFINANAATVPTAQPQSLIQLTWQQRNSSRPGPLRQRHDAPPSRANLGGHHNGTLTRRVPNISATESMKEGMGNPSSHGVILPPRNPSLLIDSPAAFIPISRLNC